VKEKGKAANSISHGQVKKIPSQPVYNKLWWQELAKNTLSCAFGGIVELLMSKDPGTEDRLTDDKNVYDLFTGQPVGKTSSRQFVRLAPELDGLEMLYSNKLNPGKVFAMRILCWGLRGDGEVVGLIPWMEKITPCPEVSDPLDGHFEGYYDPGIDEVFFEAPIHKIVELETSAEYYEYESDNPQDVVQEIPDTIGTHAVFNAPDSYHLILTEIVSWQLRNDGSLHAMVVDNDKCKQTPVLPGDDCLYSASEHKHFRYFFQHHIANKIKEQDPEALAAIAMLVEKELANKDQKNVSELNPSSRDQDTEDSDLPIK
jgi:hypothetical protein